MTVKQPRTMAQKAQLADGVLPFVAGMNPTREVKVPWTLQGPQEKV